MRKNKKNFGRTPGGNVGGICAKMRSHLDVRRGHISDSHCSSKNTQWSAEAVLLYWKRSINIATIITLIGIIQSSTNNIYYGINYAPSPSIVETELSNINNNTGMIPYLQELTLYIMK